MYKILLLEDDEILSNTLKELLECEGYEILKAKNGNQAMELSFENDFDLMLLDVNVPFINGFDFLKEMRDSGDETPAFFITALIDKNSLSRGFDVGCDDYIKKPFDFDELLIRINAKLKINTHTIKYKDIEYNVQTNEIKKATKVIQMQQIDKQIFFHFLKNIDKNIDKNALFDLMKKQTDVALRVHISKIKKILDIDIKNTRGIGYKLEKI